MVSYRDFACLASMWALATTCTLIAFLTHGNRLDTLHKDLDTLRFEVNRLNDRAGFNVGVDPDEPADLRKWSRRDEHDNLYVPGDTSAVVRRDTFDRRPSSGKGGVR